MVTDGETQDCSQQLLGTCYLPGTSLYGDYFFCPHKDTKKQTLVMPIL